MVFLKGDTIMFNKKIAAVGLAAAMLFSIAIGALSVSVLQNDLYAVDSEANAVSIVYTVPESES